jgi:hypothetical protein
LGFLGPGGLGLLPIRIDRLSAGPVDLPPEAGPPGTLTLRAKFR